MMRTMRRQRSGIVTFFTALALILCLACCDRDDGGGDDGGNTDNGSATAAVQAVQQAAMVANGIGTIGTSSVEATAAATAAFTQRSSLGAVRIASAALEVNREIDRTIYFDNETGGTDPVPFATGQIGISGTAAVSATLGSGGTVTVDPLQVLFLTDVTVSDNDSEFTAGFEEGDSLDFTATGDYELTGGTAATVNLDMTADVQDLDVTVATNNGTIAAQVDAAIEIIAEYIDENITDETPGTVTAGTTLSTTVVLTDADGTSTVEFDITIDNTTDPPTEEITATVNGKDFGPYTLQEFEDFFGVPAYPGQ